MKEHTPFDCPVCEALWQRENIFLPNLPKEQRPADANERFQVECQACQQTFALGTHCAKDGHNVRHRVI